MRAVSAILLCLLCYCSRAQSPGQGGTQARIDSLLGLVRSAGADTHRVIYLNELLKEHVLANEYAAAETYGREAIALALKLNYNRGLSRAYNGLGNLYRDQGNYAKSLEYFLLSLRLNEQSGDSVGAAINRGNIGIIYKNLKDYPKALNHFVRALSTFEGLHDKVRMSSVLNNLGILYWSMGDETSFSKQERLGFYERALYFYFRALEIDEQMNMKGNIAIRLGNIATIYKGLGDLADNTQNRDSLHQLALDYFDKAFAVNKEKERKRNVAVWIGNMANIYVTREKFKEAETMFLKAIALTDSMGLLEEKSSFCHNLSDLYRITGDYRKSLEYYRLYSRTRDSIFNETKNKELLRNEMNYEFEKKEAGLKSEQEKKEALAEEARKRQLLLLVLVGTVALAVGIVAFLTFRTLRITRSQKQIIENQKELVEQKQKEVLDSIHYAKRIQQSLMPGERYLERTLKRLKGKE